MMPTFRLRMKNQQCDDPLPRHLCLKKPPTCYGYPPERCDTDQVLTPIKAHVILLTHSACKLRIAALAYLAGDADAEDW